MKKKSLLWSESGAGGNDAGLGGPDSGDSDGGGDLTGFVIFH